MPAELNDLKRITERVDPFAFATIPEFLSALYNEAKIKLPRFSYRLFSAQLGFGSTNVVHLFIRQKRPISIKAAQRICQALGLDEKASTYMIALCSIKAETTPQNRKQAMLQIIDLKQKYAPSGTDRRQIEYASTWYNPVIREMVSLPNFQPDPKWIAKHIHPKITTARAKSSLELLVRLGFLHFDTKSCEYIQADSQIKTGSRLDKLYAISSHKEAIPLGIDALMTVPGVDRSISAVTLSISQDQFIRIRKSIARFQRELFDIESNRDNLPPDRVVQVNIQLFPTTKKTKG